MNLAELYIQTILPPLPFTIELTRLQYEDSFLDETPFKRLVESVFEDDNFFGVNYYWESPNGSALNYERRSPYHYEKSRILDDIVSMANVHGYGYGYAWDRMKIVIHSGYEEGEDFISLFLYPTTNDSDTRKVLFIPV